MEDNRWSFGLSTAASSYQSALKPFSDLWIDFEEIEEDHDFRTEYPCPFCREDFDLVELYCHIDDEHHLEAKSVVCPICAIRVGTNMVGHIMTHHGNLLKSFQQSKLQKGEPYSTLSFLKKELQDGCLRSPLSGSSSVVSSSKMAPDPLLSFLYNVPSSGKSDTVQHGCLTEVTLEEKSSNEKTLERNAQPSPLSDKEHMERAKKSEFVQGLLLSTIFDDGL